MRFRIQVLKNMPHGFLSLKDASDETLRYYNSCTRAIDDALNQPVALADIPSDQWVSFYA